MGIDDFELWTDLASLSVFLGHASFKIRMEMVMFYVSLENKYTTFW